MASITMAHSAYIKPESSLLPTLAYNTLSVIQDSTSFIPKATGITSVATGVLQASNDTIAVGVGAYVVWSGVNEYNKLLPSTSLSERVCVGTTLTGGAARIARAIIGIAKNVLQRVSVLKAIPVLSGVYTALSGLVYSMLLVPKVLDIIENIKLRNTLYAKEEYATEEESLRVKFELIKRDYVITEGDIAAYTTLNGVKSRKEAIEAQVKGKKKHIQSRYGKKTFEALEKLIPAQVEGKLSKAEYAPDEGASEALFDQKSQYGEGIIPFANLETSALTQIPEKKEEDFDINSIKEVVEVAKKELDKSIKLKFALTGLLAITGLSVIAITFATGGFSALFFQGVLLVSSILLALKDVYGLYQSVMSDKLKKSDTIALGLALGITFISVIIGCAEAGQLDMQSGVILGSWTLFAAMSALVAHVKTKQTTTKKAL